MNPEHVNPSNFNVHKIIYNDGGFSIVWGHWNPDNWDCLAARWNGEGDSLGHPSAFGNPMWFVLPPSLSVPLAQALVSVHEADSAAVLDVLRGLVS